MALSKTRIMRWLSEVVYKGHPDPCFRWMAPVSSNQTIHHLTIPFEIPSFTGNLKVLKLNPLTPNLIVIFFKFNFL